MVYKKLSNNVRHLVRCFRIEPNFITTNFTLGGIYFYQEEVSGIGFGKDILSHLNNYRPSIAAIEARHSCTSHALEHWPEGKVKTTNIFILKSQISPVWNP